MSGYCVSLKIFWGTIASFINLGATGLKAKAPFAIERFDLHLLDKIFHLEKNIV